MIATLLAPHALAVKRLTKPMGPVMIRIMKSKWSKIILDQFLV